MASEPSQGTVQEIRMQGTQAKGHFQCPCGAVTPVPQQTYRRGVSLCPHVQCLFSEPSGKVASSPQPADPGAFLSVCPRPTDCPGGECGS